MTEVHVGVLGASSLVGECLMTQLLSSEVLVSAFSRQPLDQPINTGITWHSLAAPQLDGKTIQQWICAAPIWVLPEHFTLLEAAGARRVVALSSTSRFTKTDSNDAGENAVAARLIEAESAFIAWAERCGIEWIILRPTLIYGFGRDKNISEIAAFIGRFGFFPLLGKACGLRQPIHVDDVASACCAAITSPAAANRAYNITGSERLSYREMVTRIFAALKLTPRLLPVPLSLFRLAIAILRHLPRYRQWSAAMAERMNRDLVFDYSDAARDLAFKPRAFVLSMDEVKKPKR